MIHDVDKSLRALLLATVVRGGNVEVSFDMPDKAWAAKRTAPTINAYLFEISEDLDRRAVQFEPQHDAAGIVVARRTPKRRFKLEYLISAWAERAEDEHRMLSAVLETLVLTDVLPEAHLQGALPEVAPIGLTTGLPVKGKTMSELWRPMGSGVRPALHVVALLPVGGRVDPHVGPPVLEGPVIGLRGPDGELLSPMGRFDRPSEPAEDVPAAAIQPAAAEVVDAGRFRGGRRVQELAEEQVQPGRRIGVRTLDPRTPPTP